MNFKKIICSVLTVTTTLLGFQAGTLGTAFAADLIPICSTAGGVNSPRPGCSSTRVGFDVVSVPQMKWTLLSADIIATARQGTPTSLDQPLSSGDRRSVTGNSSATLLELPADKVAEALSTYPANVPFAVGRYEPISKTLRVDIFKLERSVVAGKQQSALYQTTFSPSYGEYWKAAGSYLAPADKEAGKLGPNPFAAFATPGSDSFSQITLAGAMVAMGHAQRYVGAPLSILISAQPQTDQYTRTSGSWWRKTKTTYVDYYAKPDYYLGAPKSVQGGTEASFCANDPTKDTCMRAQSASSGVSFVKQTGGNIMEERELMHQWSQSTSGLSLLAIIAIATVLGFGLVVMNPFLLSAALRTNKPNGTGTTTATKLYETLLGQSSGLGESSTLAVAIREAALLSTGTGAQAGAPGTYSPTEMLTAQQVAIDGNQDAGSGSANEYRDVMAGKRPAFSKVQKNRITGPLEDAPGAVLSQITGDCGTQKLLSGCISQSGTAPRGGLIPRADQYNTFNGVQFMRDNGVPVRVGL